MHLMPSMPSARPSPRALATLEPRRERLAPVSAVSSSRVDSSASTSTSSSSPPPSSAASFPRFAVLAAAVAGLAAVGGAAAPQAAAQALIDAASSPSTSIDDPRYLAENLHRFLSPPPVVADLAESNDFWSNLLRYVSFYFSVLLGTAATASKPIIAALRRSPASAAGVVAVAALLFFFVSKTVGAMLGVDDGSPDDLSAFLNQVD